MSNEGRHLFDEQYQLRRRLTWAAAIAALVAIALWLTGLGTTLELKLQDSWASLAAGRAPSAAIALVELDSKLVGQHGNPPWPRELWTPLIDKLREAGASAIIFDLAFSRGSRDSEHNQELARAMQSAGNVVFGVVLDGFDDASPPGGELESWLEEDSLPVPEQTSVMPASQMEPPVMEFAWAAAVGHVSALPDADGKFRSLPSVLRHGSRLVPSLAVQAGRLHMGVPLEQLRYEDTRLDIGPVSVPLSAKGKVLLNWPSTLEPEYPSYSYVDVMRGDVGLEAFRAKTVLVLPTVRGVDECDLPFYAAAPCGWLHATFLDNLYTANFIQYPNWSWLTRGVLTLLFALLAVGLYPRLKTGLLLAVVPVLALALLGVSLYLYMMQRTWLPPFYPLLSLLLPYVTVAALRFRQTEEKSREVATEKAETQLQLGLSFQEKGMLDMAMVTYEKLPMSEDMKLVYYNLGLDFENRGLREKAFLAYKKVLDLDPDYEDVKARIEGLRQSGVGTRAFHTPTMNIAQQATSAMPTATPGTEMAATTPDAEATSALEETGELDATRDLGSERTAAGTHAMPGGAPPAQASSSGSISAVPGSQFGRYEIVKKLGKGAMGEVFLVTDTRIGRKAAMKTIRVDVEMSPQQAIQMRQRFYREAQTAGRLTHPNIVTVYDVGEEQGVSYIVMEFVEGQTLGNLTKERRLKVPQIKHVIAAAATGLGFAHDNGVFHRDVKPDNIMISKTGVVKVMDFGIARLVESDMTRTGSVLGTPAYMSPEQFSGKKIDGRSDIFSLGVVLYELLTGKRPFLGNTPTEIMFAILQHNPEPPSVVTEGVAPVWDEVLKKALAKNVDERYQTCQELVDAVMAVK